MKKKKRESLRGAAPDLAGGEVVEDEGARVVHALTARVRPPLQQSHGRGTPLGARKLTTTSLGAEIRKWVEMRLE